MDERPHLAAGISTHHPDDAIRQQSIELRDAATARMGKFRQKIERTVVSHDTFYRTHPKGAFISEAGYGEGGCVADFTEEHVFDLYYDVETNRCTVGKDVVSVQWRDRPTDANISSATTCELPHPQYGGRPNG